MIPLIKQYYRKYREIFLYLVFGVLTTIVNYVAYWVFTRPIPLPLAAANMTAWALAVAFAYATNRKWVFASKKTGSAVWGELAAFVASRLFSGATDTLLMVLLVERLGFHDMLIKLGVNVIVVILNYVLSKLIVFRKASASKDEKIE